jgi:cysteine-rich repeat protein
MAALSSVVLAAALIGAGGPSLSFHLVKVKEVFVGSDIAPNAQYVMLQLPAPGENFVGGKQVKIFDRTGTLISTFTFPANMPNGANQATILVATPEALAFFAPGPALTADLAMTPVLPPLGGKVCFFDPLGFGDVDCASWGGYTGSGAGVGAPFNFPVGLVKGAVMRRRMDICAPTNTLETCDDTDDSANDFVLQNFPAPMNNAGVSGAIPPSTCGNNAVQSLEQCDDGNLASGDGCSQGCKREPGAFASRALVLDPVVTGTSDGNGVLEPGEQVPMRPTWRNVSSVTLRLTAALSTFAGPAGATYDIPDALADYAMVAPGADGSCAAGVNCYIVSVSAPPARPLTHWDAVAPEVNLYFGFKTWSVHIGDSFSDVPRGSPFYRFVETLLHRGITTGCSATAYCPTAATTREAMAVFVIIARDGGAANPPACGTPMFNDVPASSPFCRWIEELARRGVVSGCGGGNYCPGAPVSRDAMAVFALRTLDPVLNPPACVTPMFNDVPASSPFCRWIEELARRGVVSGCGGGNYCPGTAVSREQMGVFLTVTFGLTLYGV